jgi:hypothetical protein
MDVAIDEAWHQRAPAAIDDLCLRASHGLLAHLAHAVSLDQELAAPAQLFLAGLEQAKVLEVDLGQS